MKMSISCAYTERKTDSMESINNQMAMIEGSGGISGVYTIIHGMYMQRYSSIPSALH